MHLKSCLLFRNRNKYNVCKESINRCIGKERSVYQMNATTIGNAFKHVSVRIAFKYILDLVRMHF